MAVLTISDSLLSHLANALGQALSLQFGSFLRFVHLVGRSTQVTLGSSVRPPCQA
jgi:hypothetical protein